MTIEIEKIAEDKIFSAIESALNVADHNEDTGKPSPNTTDQDDQDTTDLDSLHYSILDMWKKLQAKSGLQALFPTRTSLNRAGAIDQAGNPATNLSYSTFFAKGKLTSDNRNATGKLIDLLCEALDRGIKFGSTDRVATYKGYMVVAKAYQAFLSSVKDSDLIAAIAGHITAKATDLSAANAARRTLAKTYEEYAKPLAEESSTSKLVRFAKGVVKAEKANSMRELEADPITTRFNEFKQLERANILSAKLDRGVCSCGDQPIGRVFTRKSGDLPAIDKLVCQTEIDTLLSYGIPGYSRFSVETMASSGLATDITGYVMTNGKVSPA